MTGLDPETRFERHKYGVKDNHYVRCYGVRLRPDLFAELEPLPYAEAEGMGRGLGGALGSDGGVEGQKSRGGAGGWRIGAAASCCLAPGLGSLRGARCLA